MALYTNFLLHNVCIYTEAVALQIANDYDRLLPDNAHFAYLAPFICYYRTSADSCVGVGN